MGNTLYGMILTAEGEYKVDCPHMPDRIMDNFPRSDADISIAPWCSGVSNDVGKLRFLVEEQPRLT